MITIKRKRRNKIGNINENHTAHSVHPIKLSTIKTTIGNWNLINHDKEIYPVDKIGQYVQIGDKDKNLQLQLNWKVILGEE